MAKKHYCARFSPTLEPEQKVTFPAFKKVIERKENGDQIEKFVELSEEEKKNLRASSAFVNVGDGSATRPLPRDKFAVYDEAMAAVDSLTDEEIEELKKGGKI